MLWYVKNIEGTIMGRIQPIKLHNHMHIHTNMHIYVAMHSTSVGECLLCVRQVLEAENTERHETHPVPAPVEFLF